MGKQALTLVVAVAVWLPGQAQDPQARRIQERFEAARPDDQSLAFYSLDWAMSLAEAKDRARRDGRPILLVLNTNITAGTNFFTGHT
jgi:hypothetical protein